MYKAIAEEEKERLKSKKKKRRLIDFIDFDYIDIRHWFGRTSASTEPDFCQPCLSLTGQERYGNMTRVYYREALGALVVFDMTRLATFQAVLKWKRDLDSKVSFTNHLRKKLKERAAEADQITLNCKNLFTIHFNSVCQEKKLHRKSNIFIVIGELK